MNSDVFIEELPPNDVLIERYPDQSDFGRRMRHFRTQRGVTQERLATLINSKADYMRRLENGETKYPRLDTVCKIAAALQIDAGELIWGLRYE